MSNVYFSSDYIPKKRNNERAELIKEYERLQALEERKPRYSTSNNVYKTVYLILTGGLLFGCFTLLVYMAGQKSGKDKCKR